jgi:hypothetical protein
MPKKHRSTLYARRRSYILVPVRVDAFWSVKVKVGDYRTGSIVSSKKRLQ